MMMKNSEKEEPKNAESCGEFSQKGALRKKTTLLKKKSYCRVAIRANKT